MSLTEALYAGLAAPLLAGLWIVFKSGYPRRPNLGEKLQPRMPTDREQLLKARAEVKHQLALQPVRNRVNDAKAQEELVQILSEIKPNWWKRRQTNARRAAV